MQIEVLKVENERLRKVVIDTSIIRYPTKVGAGYRIIPHPCVDGVRIVGYKKETLTVFVIPILI